MIQVLHFYLLSRKCLTAQSNLKLNNLMICLNVLNDPIDILPCSFFKKALLLRNS